MYRKDCEIYREPSLQEAIALVAACCDPVAGGGRAGEGLNSVCQVPSAGQAGFCSGERRGKGLPMSTALSSSQTLHMNVFLHEPCPSVLQNTASNPAFIFLDALVKRTN